MSGNPRPAASNPGSSPGKIAKPVFLAGIWVVNPDDRLSCAIITEPARGASADIHPRMPLTLDDDSLHAWLDPTVQGRDALRESIDRLEPEVLTCWRVSTAVNRAGNDDPRMVEPLKQ